MRIKNTIKPVKVNKTNERLCANFNQGQSFYDLYKKPSARKEHIYAQICAEANYYNHSGIHCVGNYFTFSICYVYKEHDRYYLKYIMPGCVRNIEVTVEEV